MLNDIKKPISNHLEKFEDFFKQNMNSDIKLLNLIVNYIVRRKGKQLRPMLVFLSAGACGKIEQPAYVAAGMIELLHTATLIHDDIVDEAYERRGFFSINALWRSKVAVLVGDFLLSRGLQVAIEHNQIDMLRVINQAVKDMSEGELLQIERSRKMNIDEETYYEIIRKKTASLIASCCANGAIATKAPDEMVDTMYQFGLNLGIAFQIRDDLFDYQPSGAIGKPTGNDIKEQKLTLPLIYSLKNANKQERKRILRLITRGKKESIPEIIAFAKHSGGLEYTHQKMLEFRDKAKDILNNIPDSEYKDSLLILTDFMVNRNK
ncbi:polyprenyl synthetase family protein [Tenuifilum thalassicum]|uniref:Polyprenyl synthetase family protein n=1 Tax=Tenuifilum thalassicum TaxID=2590900 RepID=A0A7D4AYU9_9BACT|nr:polyprenyl synthetase family protein [Tenuifilum thalassicum]QKG81034.1 polyprenyl synthetase family protein [Tenuifilum thalassicum]